MSIIKKNRMNKFGARGMNMQAVAEATDDLKQHIEIGIIKGDIGESHFAVEDGDVWVEVRLVPTEQPVTCRMSTVAGAPGMGVWMVPAEGTEVVVAFPNGKIDAGGIVIAVLSSANVPSGVAENQIVIAAPSVLVYDTTLGNAKELPTMAEFRAHTHSTGTGPSGPTIDPIPSVGVITGTTVFKAE